MARRNEHTKDQLKSLVLESATDIIKNSGIEQLSTRKIAKDIGYAPGTLYNIFKDSNDIILHVNAQTMLEIMNVFTQPKQEHNLEVLLDLIGEYIDYIESNYKIWSCLFMYNQSSDQALPDWYIETLDFILQVIGKSISGNAESDTNVAELSRLIWNSVNGLCFMSFSAANYDTDFSEVKAMCTKLVSSVLR